MIPDFKIKVNPEESRIVQEIAFEHGYEWVVHKKQICHTEMPYLYIDNSDMTINFGNRRKFFENVDKPQISFQKFLEKYATSMPKEEPMNEEKKIIGYRPKPDAPIDAIDSLSDCGSYNSWKSKNYDYYSMNRNEISIENFRKHGVLDLWFDPVYKDDHKPTKHVAVSDLGNMYNFYVYSPKSVDVYKNDEYVITVSLKKVRLILKHLENQIKVHGYQFSISNDAVVGFGCVKMTFENFVYAIDNILDGEEE